MKHLENKIIILTIILLAACAPKAENKKLQTGPLEFKPNTQDSELDRSLISSKTSDDLFLLKDGSTYLKSTNEILEFSETLLDLANLETDSTSRKNYIELSEKVRLAYYNNNQNYSQFDEKSSLYVDLALGLSYDGGPDANLKETIFSSLDLKETKLSIALSKLKLTFKPQIDKIPNVSLTIQDIIDFLKSIPMELSQNEVDESVTIEIKKSLESDFVPLLVAVQKNIQSMDVKSKPEINLAILEKTLQSFSILPEEVLQPLLEKLNTIRDLTAKVSLASNSDKLFDVLFDLWLNPMINKNQIKEANEELYNFFNSMTLEQINWLKSYNLSIVNYQNEIEKQSWWKKAYYNYIGSYLPSATKLGRMLSEFTIDPYTLTFKMWYAKKRINEIGVQNITRNLQLNISSAIVEGLDSTIRLNAKLLVFSVGEKISKAVGDNIADIKKNLKDILRNKAYSELKVRMFDVHPKFVAIEGAQSGLVIKKNKLATINNSIDAKTIVSSAQTLGLALSLQSKRLQYMDHDQQVSKSSRQYYEEVFAPLNKLMAIGGFKYMEETRPRFEGLFRQVKGGIDDHDMNIFSYGLEKDYFSVPEQIVISEDFKLNKNLTNSFGKIATVAGNAELMRGAASMMIYFRDWIKNGYDESFIKEQYEGISIFPKEDFYALSLGVASVPLRNLMRDGMVAYTLSGVKRESKSFDKPTDYTTDECPKPESEDPVTSVALVDVTANDQGDLVKSADLARFILALDVFLISVEGAENSKAGPLLKVENGIRANMKAVRCGKESVKSLMMGLANFLISKMQLVDGGFAHQYSLKQKSIVPDLKVSSDTERAKTERYLEDQLLVIQALKKVFDHWNGKAYANLAVDTYHFMNSKLFDSKLGFYRPSEQGVGPVASDLRLMSMTLEALHSLKPLVPAEDLTQLNFLIQTWTGKLQDFGLHRFQ